MLTGIRTSSLLSTKKETALDLLLGCHQRIRHFTAIARRMAENPAASLDEVSEAAEAVHRYFTVALPLHEADENDSIDPRLQAAGNIDLAHASEEMVRQHKSINVVLRQLLPLWDALCREPEKLPGFVPRLLQLITEFEQLWDVHLRLEEETVFPAIEKSLPSHEVEAILREMRERRGMNGESYKAG
jgi:hemerythrin-like domain-containing protein